MGPFMPGTGETSTPTQNSYGMDLGSIVGGGASLLGDVFNLFGQSSAARQAQQWARDTAQIQRNWALEDRTHQEEYTAPQAQMARLKAAGLNPNLVYGEGVQATGQSEQPRSVDFGMPQFNSGLSSFGNLGGQVMQAMAVTPNINQTLAETQKTTESINNVKAEYQGQLLDNVTKSISNVILRTDPRSEDNAFIRGFFRDLGIDKESYGVDILKGQGKAAGLLAQKVATEIDNMREGNVRDWLKNGREQLYNAKSLEQMSQAISNMVKTGANIDQDTLNKAAEFTNIITSTAGKELDNQLKSDPLYNAGQAYKHIADMMLLVLAMKNLKGAAPRNPIGFKY